MTIPDSPSPPSPDEMHRKVQEYEGLVIATTRYWRDKISSDYTDEDIEQELRMKVWKALERYDSTRGYPEKNHVFGYVRNRVKDLMDKKHREFFETSVDFSYCERAEFLNSYVDAETREKIFDLSEKKNVEATDLITCLPRDQQAIAVLMVQGYNLKEMSSELGIPSLVLREKIASMRLSVLALLDERKRM